MSRPLDSFLFGGARVGGRVAHASSRYGVFDDVGYKKCTVGVIIIIYYHTSMVGSWYHTLQFNIVVCRYT